MLSFNCAEIQIYADQNHAVAHLVPERDGIRSVGTVFGHNRELCLRHTRDELCESKGFIIGKIGQRLNIVNDELMSSDRAENRQLLVWQTQEGDPTRLPRD